MSVQVITGKQDEIARQIANMPGHVVKALVWVEDAAPRQRESREIDALLADLDKDTVNVGNADDSREAIYTRMGDE